MSKFRPGETAIVVRDDKMDPVCYPLAGRECTIVEVDEAAPESHARKYLVEVQGTTFGWIGASVFQLAKKRPPGWELTTWGECLWKPKLTRKEKKHGESQGIQSEQPGIQIGTKTG